MQERNESSTRRAILFGREPKWIKEAQKPDFYCRGRKPFWCEVKTLERPEDADKFHRALHDLTIRTNSIGGTGCGIARCQAQVLVCSCCDRGQIYCTGGCAQEARHQAQRAAGGRYQASPPRRHV